jgi:hypothetical protein
MNKEIKNNKYFKFGAKIMAAVIGISYIACAVWAFNLNPAVWDSEVRGLMAGMIIFSPLAGLCGAWIFFEMDDL